MHAVNTATLYFDIDFFSSNMNVNFKLHLYYIFPRMPIYYVLIIEKYFRLLLNINIALISNLLIMIYSDIFVYIGCTIYSYT